MPEGHTLHRLARLHQRRFAGAPVAVSSPQGRFTGAASLTGRVFTRAQLLQEVWGYDFPTTANSLEVYVGYLRRKTEAESEPRLIHTVRRRSRMVEVKSSAKRISMPAGSLRCSSGSTAITCSRISSGSAVSSRPTVS